MTKVIAFDIFGTVFDLSRVDRQEIRDYANHIRKPEWEPLHLPSSWEMLPAFADAAEGIDRLRENHTVVTLSNGPIGLQIKLAKNNGIQWDGIIPLEIARTYKPKPEAYRFACEVLGVEPEEVIMVTANKDFGDIEQASNLGMGSALIRHPHGCRDIIDLAKLIEISVE